MKLNKIKLIIGFVLVLVPVLGFPRWVKSTTSIFIGAVIILYSMAEANKDSRKKHKKINKHDSFVESKPQHIHTEIKTEPEKVPEPVIDLRKEENIPIKEDVSSGPHIADAEKE